MCFDYDSFLDFKDHETKLGKNAMAIPNLHNFGLSAITMSLLWDMGIVKTEHLLMHNADQLIQGGIKSAQINIIYDVLGTYGLKLEKCWWEL